MSDKVEISKIQIQKYKSQIKNLQDKNAELIGELDYSKQENGLLHKTIDTINKVLDKEPKGDGQHNFIGIFKVFNGEATYSIIQRTYAKTEAEATRHFKERFEGESNVDIWELRHVVLVKDFADLWGLI